MIKNKQCFGIDFGTTSSAVVNHLIDVDGKIHKINYGDIEGRPIPSVVAIDRETGEVYTGEDAKYDRFTLSSHCEYVASVKMFLDEEYWHRNIAGKEWTTVDVAAELFKSLKREVSEQGGDLSQAVVAIPIDFSSQIREKLREAALKAGIEVRDFVSEPTAAFYANYEVLSGASTVAVFDWGGGTLDVSILAHESGQIRELATSGMSVAGDNIDRKLAEKIHMKFCRKKEISIAFDDMPAKSRDMLIDKAERAKRKLNDRYNPEEEVKVSINRYGKLGAVNTVVGADWLDEIIRPEVEAAVACLLQAIEESKVGRENIDAVLLVGGTSLLSLLRECLGKEFPIEKLVYPEESMWSAGEGAACLAEHKGTYYSNQRVGIKLADGSEYDFLQQGDKIPGWHKEATFALADTRKEIRLVITGSNDLHEQEIIDVPAYRFLDEKIELEANIDHNHVFVLTARSDCLPEKYKVCWQYGKLKFYYQLPKSKGVM